MTTWFLYTNYCQYCQSMLEHGAQDGTIPLTSFTIHFTQMRESNPVLERFLEATNITSISDLADFLGISRQAIYSALNNNKFPKEWYFKVAEMTVCSMDWLVHGIGPKKRPKTNNPPAESNFLEIIDTMSQLLVGTSGNITEMNRCTILLCQKLLSQKEELNSSQKEEKKNSRLINIKQFAYRVSSYEGA